MISSAKDIINLELQCLNIKLEYLPEYKKRHSYLLNRVENMISDDVSLVKIKKHVLREISLIYNDLIMSGLLVLARDTFNIMDVSPKLFKTESITAMGLSLDEMIASRIHTHYRDIISQTALGGINMNKTKKRQLNAMVGLSEDYLKATRDEAYKIIESKQDNIKGWLYSSIIDRRTSTLCISLNNKFYSVKRYKTRSELPYVPIVSTHINCRSMLITIYKDDDIEKFKNISLDEFIINDSKEARKLIGDRKYNLLKDKKLKAKDIFDYKKRKFFTLKEIKSNLEK